MNQLKAGGVVRSFATRSAIRGPGRLSSMRVEAVLKAHSTPLGTEAAEGQLLAYEGV
jgi:hypothetical protein